VSNDYIFVQIGSAPSHEVDALAVTCVYSAVGERKVAAANNESLGKTVKQVTQEARPATAPALFAVPKALKASALLMNMRNALSKDV